MNWKNIILISVFLSPIPVLAESNPVKTEPSSSEVALFAGGCFWCIESDFDKIKGVLKTTSGYTGGIQENPTYKQVSAGLTRHAETVKIEFDPQVVSYRELLDIFWHRIDPTAKNKQFCDQGSQYRSAIYYLNSSQQKLAEASLEKLKISKPFKKPVVTEITKAMKFYPAESYHQDYHQKNPIRYNYYRYSCGRDKRLSEIWGEKG